MESAASASVSSGVPLLGVLEVRAERVRTRIGFCSLQRDKVRGGRSLRTGIKAIDGATVAEVADPGRVEVTWQIVAGAVAGVTPFIVAGIEFSKRIVAQRRCGVCGGSGLVKREKYYFRCPRCGGFLPWQSWKRFFSG